MSEEKTSTGGNKVDRKPQGGRPQGGRPQRGPPLSPAQQRRRFAEERISKRTAKTELGQKVVS